ncbi:MAG TPA: hypothetical protein VN661_01340 [Candidatus Acidoferrales bacterium]|nr:hypothetical protein [Candidatus Acidoferrales bacterium]
MTEYKKQDPFKPQQPQIPGVKPKAEPKPHAEAAAIADEPSKDGPLPLWVTVAAVAFLVLVVGLGWWAVASPHRATTDAGQDAAAATDQAPAEPTSTKVPVSPPGAIASVAEMQRPWSAKRFVFAGPAGKVPAMAVKLPSGDYWGFALKEPYGDCQLEYVSSMETLASKYHFRASHPMVGDPCTGTVYDLAQYGNAPGGLVRGAIVQGTALRPPLAIEIAARGKDVVAVRME